MCPCEIILEAIVIIAGVTSTMASFDEEDFAAKLKNLGTSQKDINTPKFMIVHHSKIDSARNMGNCVLIEVTQTTYHFDVSYKRRDTIFEK